MIAEIDCLFKAGFFSSLDYHFAQSMAEQSGESSPLVLLGAATASYYTRLGHVCVPLGAIAGCPVQTPEGEPPNDERSGYEWPQKDLWIEALRGSPLIGAGGDLSPLVLQEERLYLFRYWQYEYRLAMDLLCRGRDSITKAGGQKARNKLVDALFPLENEKVERQRAAAIGALGNRLTIISGGPGTGKTTTVLRLLVAVADHFTKLQQRAPSIILMAPTGKAAARLSESIRQAKTALAPLPGEAFKATLRAIPDKANTIHKVLRPRPDNSTRFIYSRENPLPADIVVVDEASMIDVALMTKLFDAVPRGARMVLLGDKNQLASVEAGSVFGDICEAWEAAPARSGFAERVVHLTHSFRFAADKGIGRVSSAISRGDFPSILRALEEDPKKQIQFLDCPSDSHFERHIKAFTLANYRNYLAEADPLKSLEEFERSRILCAHKRGPRSVEQAGQIAEAALAEQNLLHPTSEWYEGRPILVARNDSHLGLRNGDLGLVWPSADGNGELAAFFRGDDEEGHGQAFSLSRLPPCETVFAMTVHKSQGSEYDEVLLVLPEHPSPVLTRELLYTAVTRAKKRVIILATKRILEYTTLAKVNRTSGLKQLLRRHEQEQLSFGFL